MIRRVDNIFVYSLFTSLNNFNSFIWDRARFHVLGSLKRLGTKITVIFLIQLGPSELIEKKMLIEKGGKIL